MADRRLGVQLQRAARASLGTVERLARIHGAGAGERLGDAVDGNGAEQQQQQQPGRRRRRRQHGPAATAAAEHDRAVPVRGDADDGPRAQSAARRLRRRLDPQPIRVPRDLAARDQGAPPERGRRGQHAQAHRSQDRHRSRQLRRLPRVRLVRARGSLAASLAARLPPITTTRKRNAPRRRRPGRHASHRPPATPAIPPRHGISTPALSLPPAPLSLRPPPRLHPATPTAHLLRRALAPRAHEHDRRSSLDTNAISPARTARVRSARARGR